MTHSLQTLFPSVTKMAIVTSGVLYIISIVIQSQTGENLLNITSDISRVLVNSTDINILYKFKVVGEAKIITVVEASNEGLERTVASLWRLGQLEIDSQPVITYENFARNLGVSDELTQPVSPDILQKDRLFLLNAYIGHLGNTTEELLASWKKEAEFALEARKRGELRLVSFKSLAERQIMTFINAPDPIQLDLLSFQLPLVQALGSNILTQSSGLQFLDD